MAAVLILYRNFRHHTPGSHVGLGVNGLHTAKVLRRLGHQADLVGVWTYADVQKALAEAGPITHCVIEAAFLSAAQMNDLLTAHPRVKFTARNHSQIGFLQVEPGAIGMFRDYAALQEGTLNFELSANSSRFCEHWREVYGQRCTHLPNLYELGDRAGTNRRELARGRGAVRIGSFGALRLLKNHTTAATAALMATKGLGADLEFHVNSNRSERGGMVVLDALRAQFKGLPWAKLVEVPWANWTEFRHVVARMDCCIQVSFTETFNLVTADACAEGVPSAVSPAIEWAPKSWTADPDDAADVAKTVEYLVDSQTAPRHGLDALKSYLASAEAQWQRWLGVRDRYETIV